MPGRTAVGDDGRCGNCNGPAIFEGVGVLRLRGARFAYPAPLRKTWDEYSGCEVLHNWLLTRLLRAARTYADARVVAIRNRSLTTKNGRVGHASDTDSLGIGVRAIAGGAWGFAATASMGRGRR